MARLKCNLASVSLENNNIPLVENEATTEDAKDNSIEVTQFLSSAPATEDARDTIPFPSNVAEAPVDATLGEFLSRPVLIESITWTPEVASLNGYIDPWYLFLSTTTVRNKLANYQYLRGNLHIKLNINGTPFHFGRLMFSYQPMIRQNRNPPGGPFPEYGHSSLPHVIMDPSTNAEGRIVCPFISPMTWIDLTIDTSTWIGVLNYDQLATLTYSSGVLATGLEVQVYAWMEEVELAYPTISPVATFVPQSSKQKPKMTGTSNTSRSNTKGSKKNSSKDEYTANPNAGLISRPAAAVAEVAGRLRDVPFIGPFATATEIGAGALSKIAGLFGYSRPRVLDAPTRVIDNGAGSMSIVDGPDNSFPLSVNAKSGVTIDPTVNGEAESEDNLVIQSIAGKWSLLTTAAWTAADALDTVLYASLIGPLMGAQGNTGTGIQYTALGFASLPFRYWRGGIEVRIQVVCSRYHRGRIRIAWAPDGDLASASQTNLNYGAVIDISEQTEFEFTIPYGRMLGYLQNAPTSGLYNPTNQNGAFYIAVQNPLVDPEAAAKTVTLIVWVRAAPDMEFMAPSSVQYNKLTTWIQEQSSSTKPEMTTDIMQEEERVALWEAKEHPMVNKVFGGDPIRSFRSLLKRSEYTMFMNIGVPRYTDVPSVLAGANGTLTINHPLFPPPVGTVAAGLGSASAGGVGTWDYNVNSTPLMTFLSFAFLGFKGSVRWTVTRPEMSYIHYNGSAQCTAVDLSRVYGDSGVGYGKISFPFYGIGYDSLTNTFPMTDTRLDSVSNYRNGLSAPQFFTGNTAALNYEVPLYNTERFFVTQGYEIPDNAETYYAGQLDGCILLRFRYCNPNSTTNFNLHCGKVNFAVAAGEDLSYVAWAGVPPLVLGNGATLSDEIWNSIPAVYQRT